MSSSRGLKRKMASRVLVHEPPPKSSKATLLSPSLLLLEIPADTNTSYPVWEAIRSQQLDITWTVNPYSITVHLSPEASEQSKTTSSSKSESPSSAAQTPAPSPNILQPQAIIQPLAQQHGSPKNSSCILLTFSPNSTQLLPSSPGQPQQSPPNPTPATSFIVSLPVIISQPQTASQPSTPTKNAAILPAIRTPTTTPTKPPGVPAPSTFHTRTSSDVQICDAFLLNQCHAEKKCKMHHTPYPFHWQLQCVTTQKWIDISLHSQVLLEKHYSNVSQETISLKDGRACYTLRFDEMALDDQSKYDKVRRLTNSDSRLRNPYFPSKWRIYWWNNVGWEEYNKSVSTLLLKTMSEKEPECKFYISSQEYLMDFTIMHQTNVTTGFQREVRCRPVYRSPDSMQPYLKTGIQIGSTLPAGDPPGANFNVDPLEEFSSWYPPVWCLASEQDYSLVDVPTGTRAHAKVQNIFYESLHKNKVDIISIQQVQNLLHWDKYQRHKVYMEKQSKEPVEKHLFHGTTEKASEKICLNNFDPRIAGINGNSYGFGTYFATKASLSKTYSSQGIPDGVRHMFLAKVLVGKVTVGRSEYRRPPSLKSRTKQHHLYDTCADRLDKPSMFVVFDSCQCYPYYLIKYKDLPEEIDI